MMQRCLFISLFIEIVVSCSLYCPYKSRVNVSVHESSELFGALPTVLQNSYRSGNGVFPYYDSAVAAQTLGFAPEFEIEDVLVADFFSFRDDSFAYYSGNVMHDRFSELRNKLQLNQVVQKVIKNHHILAQLSPNVWIGGPGVTATMHYDSVYNIYIHYAGTKTIRLLPPSAVHLLQVHGRMHPYACQSRVVNSRTGETFARSPFCVSVNCTEDIGTNNDQDVDLVQASTEDFLAFYNTHALEFTLYPGSVLFIPPFWFHEVQTQTPSISVSLWWDAAELDVMDQIYALPLPFEDTWDVDVLVCRAQTFVTMLVEAVEAEVNGVLLQATMKDMLDIEVLAGELTMDTLLRLLKIRYADDYEYLKHKASPHASCEDICSFGALCGAEREISLLGNFTLLEHMQNSALQRARIICTGFFSEHNFINSSSVFRSEFADIEVASSDTMSTARASFGGETYPAGRILSAENEQQQQQQQTVLQSQLAVLSMKLCDYIEDVFRHVADTVIKATDVGHQGKGYNETPVNASKSPTRWSSNPNAVAVKLLMDWIFCTGVAKN